MNRSIQAEGSFAEIKQNMGFRRYLSRGGWAKKNLNGGHLQGFC
nr:hypothetical protein [Clostridium pasteurianum]